MLVGYARVSTTHQDLARQLDALAKAGVDEAKTLADPLPVDTTTEGGALAELAIVLLTLFAQMELTFNRERAAHARAVAQSQGRQVGRPSVVDPKVLAYALHLRDVDGSLMSEIATLTGLSRATLYRHLPP